MNTSPASVAEIRFSDCDPFGHLNNARFLDYFLHAREQHLKNEYGLALQTFYDRGLSWFIRSHDIIYIKPVHYGETVLITTRLLQVAAERLWVEMMMTDQSGTTLKALLWAMFIPVNVKTGKKEAHQPEVMQTLQQIVYNDGSIEMDIEKRVGMLIGKLKNN